VFELKIIGTVNSSDEYANFSLSDNMWIVEIKDIRKQNHLRRSPVDTS
jgi:hypothetical protein